jgi:hypothetical protein
MKVEEEGKRARDDSSGENDQSILYTCMNMYNDFVQLICTNKKEKKNVMQ